MRSGSQGTRSYMPADRHVSFWQSKQVTGNSSPRSYIPTNSASVPDEPAVDLVSGPGDVDCPSDGPRALSSAPLITVGKHGQDRYGRCGGSGVPQQNAVRMQLEHLQFELGDGRLAVSIKVIFPFHSRPALSFIASVAKARCSIAIIIHSQPNSPEDL